MIGRNRQQGRAGGMACSACRDPRGGDRRRSPHRGGVVATAMPTPAADDVPISSVTDISMLEQHQRQNGADTGRRHAEYLIVVSPDEVLVQNA